MVDLPFDKWTTVSNTKIFITVPRLVHDTFYKLIIQGDIYNGQLKIFLHIEQHHLRFL